MAREEQWHAYYDEILQGRSYIDTTLSIQTCVADFLANTFFGKDFSRVIYTNPEYAFRRRVEMLAHGVNENIFITNLDLPFCSFHLTSSPRVTKVMTASEWSGYYDASIHSRVHFRNTLQDVKVQFYFSRIDDASVAFDIAQVEQLGGYPIRYQQMVYWRNKSIPLPVWITVKDIKVGNESFNETDRLTTNGMFGMTLDLEIETARIHINRGLNGVQLPFKWRTTGNVDKWSEDNDTDVVYYTQKCILDWAQAAMDVECVPSTQTRTVEAEAAVTEMIEPALKPVDDRTWLQIQSIIPNRETAEMVEGAFKSPTRITFNKLQYNPDKTEITEQGEVKACIDVIVKPSTYQYWDYTDVYVPSRRDRGQLRIKNCKDDHIIIDGLHPNSDYTIYFIAHDINGNFNTILLDITTPVWDKEDLPAVDATDPQPGQLVTTIQNTDPTKPKKIKAKGLIGLEL